MLLLSVLSQSCRDADICMGHMGRLMRGASVNDDWFVLRMCYRQIRKCDVFNIKYKRFNISCIHAGLFSMLLYFYVICLSCHSLTFLCFCVQWNTFAAMWRASLHRSGVCYVALPPYWRVTARKPHTSKHAHMHSRTTTDLSYGKWGKTHCQATTVTGIFAYYYIAVLEHFEPKNTNARQTPKASYDKMRFAGYYVRFTHGINDGLVYVLFCRSGELCGIAQRNAKHDTSFVYSCVCVSKCVCVCVQTVS